MSPSSAEAVSTRSAGTLDTERPGSPVPAPRRLSGGRLYVLLAIVALVIAAFSLLIPSTPSYDPWSWLIWGREIMHFNLQTTGGPTWKPLPVIFTTLFAPFGSAAPDLWLVIARMGALISVAMAFRLAWRIARSIGATPDSDAARAQGLARVSESAPLMLGSVIAAGSLVVSAGFISDNALGYSEGLMTALVLIAIDRHLDGERRQAFAIGFAAALDRPEIWAFWGPYGLYLWWKDPGARRLVLGLFALIPVLWFLPELWGSGHLLRGVNRAQHVRSNSAANASCPFCTELADHAWKHVLLRVKVVVAIVLAVVAVILLRQRRSAEGAVDGAEPRRDKSLRSERVLLSVGALGIAWWVLIALMTEAGFSGNDRYLVVGAALIVVAGGVGWAWAAKGLGQVIRRFSGPAAAGAGSTLVLAIVFMALPPWIGANIVDVPATHRALNYQAHLRQDLTRAVVKAGGARALLRCGTVMTEGFQVPMVAWTLGVHSLRVQASPLAGAPLGAAPRVILQTRAQRHARLLPSGAEIHAWTRSGARYTLVAHVRTFRIYSTCRR